MSHKKTLRIVYCYPGELTTNQYISSQSRVWKKLGYQVCPAPHSIFKCIRLALSGRKDHLVINWFEDRFNNSRFPIIGLIRSFFLLCLFRVAFSKIHWVKHNIRSHDSNNTIMREILVRLLCFFSDTRVAHRPFQEFTYIPHPLYKSALTSEADSRDIDFIYFGVVKKYKGLDQLLEAWPVDKKLLIVGKSHDDELENSLMKIISNRNLHVKRRNIFLPQEELNSLLYRSKFVVLPHFDNRMIVSGAAFHALECGANLIVREGVFCRYLQDRFCGVTAFCLNQLGYVIDTIKYIDPECVIAEVEAECNDLKLAELWSKIFKCI
jgi:beta-1,4-mannosyltransferase